MFPIRSARPGKPARRLARRRSAAEHNTPLLAIFDRAAEMAVGHHDPAGRLASAANVCESLAKSDPAAFEQLSADALRWPTPFVLCVLSDLAEGFSAHDSGADPSTARAQSMHVIELWLEAVRCAYVEEDAHPHDRQRAMDAMRVLRQQALGRCAVRATS